MISLFFFHCLQFGKQCYNEHFCSYCILVGSFLKKCIYFNWRLINLQYCSVFAILWHKSATGEHVSPILNPPPTSFPIPSLHSGPSQCTGPEHPVSWIEPGLVIYFTYGNIHVSMLSQIIPPLPSPTESKSLFFISVSLLLSHI